MLVLRVEDGQGHGCYQCPSGESGAFRAHNYGGCSLSDTSHPVPSRDKRLAEAWRQIIYEEHAIPQTYSRFCFTTVEQYFRWFHTTEARTILTMEEFHLAIYQVDEADTVQGDTQAVFDLRYAVEITDGGRIPCDSSYREIEEALATVEAAQTLREAMREALREAMCEALPTSPDPSKVEYYKLDIAA